MNEPIQEKTTTPPGLLPKHVQSWLILGLAVLMVVIMWLTGGKKQTSLPKANASTIQTPLPLEVNETKITDLQNRIQELQREQLAAQSALVQQNRLLGAAADPQQPQSSNASGTSTPGSTEDPIQTERKRRQYVSLFSSNIALSYRKNARERSPPSPIRHHKTRTAGPSSPPSTGPDLGSIGPSGPNPKGRSTERRNPSSDGSPAEFYALCTNGKPLPYQQVQPMSKMKARRRQVPPLRSKSRRTQRRGKLTFYSKEQFSNPFSSIVSTDSLSGLSNAYSRTTCTPMTASISSFPQERRFLVKQGGLKRSVKPGLPSPSTVSSCRTDIP